MDILLHNSMLCMVYRSPEGKNCHLGNGYGDVDIIIIIIIIFIFIIVIIIIMIMIIIFIMLAKSTWLVRSGIRTHAYKSRPRPERSALDRSAILTCTWPSDKKSFVTKESSLAKLLTFLPPDGRLSVLAPKALVRGKDYVLRKSMFLWIWFEHLIFWNILLGFLATSTIGFSNYSCYDLKAKLMYELLPLILTLEN